MSSQPPPSYHPSVTAHKRELTQTKKIFRIRLVAELVIPRFAGPHRPKEVITEKISGFEEIFKELRETVIPAESVPGLLTSKWEKLHGMGFNDGAIEQFQLALEKAESARRQVIEQVYREKGWLTSRKCYEKSMDIESIIRQDSTPRASQHGFWLNPGSNSR